MAARALNMSLHWLPNLVGFQLVWLAAVGGAARGWWWAGPLAATLFAAWQLAVTTQRRADLRLVALCAGLGFVLDTLWVQAGWMRFASPLPSAGVAPVWIVAMWVGFALTVNHSLSGLKRWPWAAALFGLVGGPLAYWVAERAWRAVDIGQGMLAYVALGLAWAIITPLLLHLGTHWQRAAPNR